MSKPLQIISISALLASLILGTLYYREIQENYFPTKIELSKQEQDLASAQEFLVSERPFEAAALAKAYQSQIVRQTPEGEKWLEILIRASENLPDTAQLVHIFNFRPSALKGHGKGHEKVALLVAEKLVTSGDIEGYETLKKLFAGQKKHPSAWFLLDGDALLAEGRSEEAAEHLKSRYLSGPDETERLLRLALLHSNEHPKVTWNYLEQALKKDPNNSDLRLWRAHMLETLGKASLAETEYLAAAKAAPEDREVAENLADYYLRHHHYKKALWVLERQLHKHPSSDLWIKTFALTKTIQPVSIHELLPSERGLNVIANIPADAFWAESASSYELDPSLSWLRILQALKEGREADALTLLNHPLEGDLGGQELRDLLKETLLYRTTQELPKNLARLEKRGHGSLSDLLDHLRGPSGLATVFLAYGWNEAALRLYSQAALSDDTPEWVAPAMTQALFENRGIKEALAFAALQKPTAPLNLLLADLYFTAGDEAKGEALLKTHVSEPTDLGRKAALKYAARLISKGEVLQAKDLLSQDPDLETSLMGQELLARIALEEKNPLLATQIYEGIETSSSEAKAFLARKAYTDKDYRRAFSLTEKLLRENPTSLALRENLQKILNQLEKIH